MTLSRKQLVAVEDTPYYYVVSRCVHRSYLFDIDARSGKDYDLFFLLDNCFCVVLISYVPVTMQDRYTPGRRTVPSQSITTVNNGCIKASSFKNVTPCNSPKSDESLKDSLTNNNQPVGKNASSVSGELYLKMAF